MSDSNVDGMEPPIREFADRGTLWLLELPENLHALVRLMAADLADHLDFSRAQRENRSFIPDDLHKQEADLLYRVPFRVGTGEVWIYVLLEHQSKPDKTMGLRLLGYMVEIWQAQQRGWKDNHTPYAKWKLFPILPLVFYTGKRKWKTPLSLAALMDVPTLLKPFTPAFETLLLRLHETPPDTLMQAGSAVAFALRALQAADEPKEVLEQALHEVVSLLDALPQSAKAEWSWAMRFLYLLVLNKRDADEQEELKDVMEEAVLHKRDEYKEVKMTGAQALINQGKREGRKEGRQEGKQEGRLEIILEQLEVRFGPLSEATVASVNALPANRLSAITRRILTAASLAELEL